MRIGDDDDDDDDNFEYPTISSKMSPDLKKIKSTSTQRFLSPDSRATKKSKRRSL